MAESILGISAYYHDSAAALLVNGRLVAAAQEERFSRLKYDASFPRHAVEYVLNEAGMELHQVNCIVFYERPLLKFERLLETYHAFAPRGITSFLSAIPVWLKDKLFLKKVLRNELEALGRLNCPILFTEHHLSHAASAFYPSPSKEAAILTIDGVGEWAVTTIGKGIGNRIELLKEIHFPHSVGLLYSAFTYYTGFRVNSGEYKLMGLAPYGIENAKQTLEFKAKILDRLVHVHEDGSICLNMEYFDFATGLKMTHNKKWKSLFGIPPRQSEDEITQDYMNLALSIQQVLEIIMMRLARHAREITGCSNLVLSGGVALNCVANGKILRSGLFKNIWIQPASGDAGGAAEYFDLDCASPYMLLVAPVKHSRHIPVHTGDKEATIWQKLYRQRSDIPAVTHIDYSARIQTVHHKTNPRFYDLLKEFSDQTGCDVLVNTSFNVRGEPIVCNQGDAYRCFMSTEMDYLVMGNFLFSKMVQTSQALFTKGAIGND